MGRKTIEVAALVSSLNGRLAAPSASREYREALCHVAEQVLLSTDNYNGFHYILPGGEPVGHRAIADGDYDEYRRRYHLTANA